MLFPFIWMLSTSLKKESHAFIFPPKLIPDPILFDNYKRVWEEVPFASGLLNSLYITVIVTVGTLFFCSLAAYAFAKLRFKGRDIIFAVLLLTMMIPKQVMIIPQFIMFSEINWIDKHVTLILPPMLVNAFAVFMLRQFFLSIPNALKEAAAIDGANPFRIYWKIMLPQTKPALASIAIFTVLAVWNDFLTPFIYLISPEKFTLPLVLQYLRGFFSSKWTILMAASSMAIVPVLIVYAFAQKYFIEGITLSGLKG